MATIIDVAKEANVSTATVSRVLNGNCVVTEEKRRLVMAAIEKVGYVPQKRIQESHFPPPASLETVGVGEKNLYLVVTSSLIGDILFSFRQTAAEMGYSTLVFQYESSMDFTPLKKLLETISHSLAGILLINCVDNSKEFQALLEPYPLVQIGEPIMQNVPNRVVYNDEIKMGEDATNFLLDKGKKKIGFLIAAPSNHVSLFKKQNRLKGYYLALIARNLPIDDSLVEYVDVTIDGGYEGMKKLLSRHPDMDAVIGITDMISQGAVYAIRRDGRTTEDVMVFSMDNNEVWDFTRGRFPYMDPHHDEMGFTGAVVLRATICGEIDRDYKVIIRHSLEYSNDRSSN